jgi:drug/metabolite transporter (DMT)-like permease
MPISKPVLGILYGVTGNLCYSLAAPIVKIVYQLNPTISVYEILYWKSLTMLVMNFLCVRSFGVFVMDIPKNYRAVILVRALVGYIGIQGYWASVKYVPVSTATCIFYTMPVWSTLYAFVYLKENIRWTDILLMIGAFCGVIIINEPWINTSDEEHTNLLFGSVFALSGALAGAVAILCMRIMKDIHFSVSPFWFAAGCTFLSPIVHCG